MAVYTLWKRKDGDDDEAIFLQEQPIFLLRRRAFKRARQLAMELPDGWGFDILVRRIKKNSWYCLQWEVGTDGKIK